MGELVEFDPDSPAAIVAHMEALAAAGRGWINVRPGVPDEPPDPSPLFRIFSGRGPVVPLGTWVALERARGAEYRSVGIQHGAGPKAIAQLADHGVALPDQTLVLADHPRRGLVVAFSVDASHAAVLGWLLLGMRLLSGVPLASPWAAAVEPG